MVALGAPRDAPDQTRVPFERQEYSPYHFRLGLSVSLGLSISLGLLRRRLSRHISASEGTRQNRKWRRDSETCSCSGSCAINQCSTFTTNWEEQAGTSRARKEVLHRKELGQPGAPSLLPHTWPSPPPPEATPPTHHLSTCLLRPHPAVWF